MAKKEKFLKLGLKEKGDKLMKELEKQQRAEDRRVQVKLQKIGNRLKNLATKKYKGDEWQP